MSMDIKKYSIFIEQQITKIEQDLKSNNNKNIELTHKKVKQLINLHQQTVRDFQHERLIHLLVTFFFAGLLLLSVMAVFLFALLPGGSYTLLSSLILLVCTFLFITEIFYIRHYYQLENGTQNLYNYSKKLYNLTVEKVSTSIDI